MAMAITAAVVKKRS